MTIQRINGGATGRSKTVIRGDLIWTVATGPGDGWPCRACVGADLAPDDLIEIKLTAARV